MQPDNSRLDTSTSHDAHEGHKLEQASAPASPVAQSGPPLYTNTFFSRDPHISAARKLYFKIMFGGMMAATFIVFGIFPILYGAFYKTPVRKMIGWVIDFDGGNIGESVIAGLSAPTPLSGVTWNVVPAAQFPGGVNEVAHQVDEDKTWIAVTVNPGASARLAAALASPDPNYDGSQAISIYAVEARNEGAYRGILIPSAQVGLTIVSTQFALKTATMVANASNLPQLMSTSPQAVVSPVAFQVFNLHPFDQPVASIVIFVGLLFVLILAFVVVMVSYAAREKTNFQQLLTYKSLLIVRIVTLCAAYFIVSLFDTLLALAFQLKTNRKFGNSGFLVLWSVNFVGMCSMGLAVESMLSLIGIPGIPFFVLIWIMVNVAVIAFPIDILPIFYRYGYAMPFYYIGLASRTIIFSTRNQVGFCFGILFAWIIGSCVLLAIFQYLSRRWAIRAERRRERAIVQ